MTSKELLRRIDERDYLTEREHREFLDRLNKYLEILEILKKQIVIDVEGIYIKDDWYEIYDYPEEYFKIANFKHYKRKPQEEDYEDENYEKIKKWLESDKNG